MGIAGMKSTIVAVDGKPFAYPSTVVAETIAAGQTMDVIVTVPSTAQPGGKYPLLNMGLRVDNNSMRTGGGSGVVNFGGQLTFIQIPADLVGPLALNVNAAPNPSDGVADVALTVTIDDSTTGNSTVAGGGVLY